MWSCELQCNLLKSGKGEHAFIVGNEADLLTRHVLRQVDLLRTAPGSKGVAISAAIFERWSRAGYIWVKTHKSKEALDLPGTLGDWRWWQRKMPALRNMIRDLDLGKDAFRPAMPQKEAGRDSVPSQCLPWPSMSVGCLLIMSLRCGLGVDKNKGAVQDDVGQAVFKKVFYDLMDRLPKDPLLTLLAFHGACTVAGPFQGLPRGSSFQPWSAAWLSK